ncbi:MAG: DUF3126 family protein [Rhodospirillales bacterium]|nr:DUF3126 family protein [Rhodospirillales bacterium]
MTPTDITRLEAYLRATLGSSRISIAQPKTRGASVELRADGEFIGTVHRDDEDGEVSFSITITVLEEDLPKTAERR